MKEMVWPLVLGQFNWLFLCVVLHKDVCSPGRACWRETIMTGLTRLARGMFILLDQEGGFYL